MSPNIYTKFTITQLVFKICPRSLHQTGGFGMTNQTESFKFMLDPPLLPWQPVVI